MQVQMYPTWNIRPYAPPPRQNDDAVGAAAAAIVELGFRQPIVVDEQDVIIVGHTRWLAAQQLGLELVPVRVATGVSPALADAYRIVDRQTNVLAGWAPELLPLELADLQVLDFNLGLLGFNDKELLNWPRQEVRDGLVDPDDIPAPPDAPITQPGDLWLLGGHRLLCGDSSSYDDGDRLRDGAVIHLVNTDPSYGARLKPRSTTAGRTGLSIFTGTKRHPSLAVERNHARAKGTTKIMRARDCSLEIDSVTVRQFKRLLDAWFGNMARVLLPGSAFYLWGGYENHGIYSIYLRRHFLYFSQGIVWDKRHSALTRKDVRGACDICFYGRKDGAPHRFFGPKNATDLWHVKNVNPTENPVELAVRAIQYSSQTGENVLDLFGGSGSTLIAAEQTGRWAYLMELDQLYCDVIVQRWEQFTGRKGDRVVRA